MATPIRKKRNFKGLGLTDKALAPLPVEPEPLPILGPSLVASRPAPTPGGLALSAKGGTDTPASDAESMIAHNGSTSSLSSAVLPSSTSAVTKGTPSALGGTKKKKPVPLSLGAKSVGGSAAVAAPAASSDRLGAEAQTNGNAGKALLDENGMLTIPNASSAPGTATLSGVSPFR